MFAGVFFFCCNTLLCFFFFHAGYQKFVDPGISPEFEAAAVRFSATMAPPGVYMRYWSYLKPFDSERGTK